jgi:hypothetical protein
LLSSLDFRIGMMARTRLSVKPEMNHAIGFRSRTLLY